MIHSTYQVWYGLCSELVHGPGIIPQWPYWKVELMKVIVMGFNPQLTHLFEELQHLRKQGWHLWDLNTQSGDAKWCEMSEWTGTPRSFISFSYETSMSRRHCFVRAHAVWLSSHSMTLGAGGLQPPSPICVHGNTSVGSGFETGRLRSACDLRLRLQHNRPYG